MNPLWYVSTGVIHGPAELACRALHYPVHDAGCIFVPANIFPGRTYLIFDFSRGPGIKIPLVDAAGYITYVGYIKEPRYILGLSQILILGGRSPLTIHQTLNLEHKSCPLEVFLF
jgi:hypothetical protein